MSLTFSRFNWREGLEAQRQLFADSFPENVGLPAETAAYYRRKFQSYPADRPSEEYVAADETGFVGYYAALPYAYSVDGTSFPQSPASSATSALPLAMVASAR